MQNIQERGIIVLGGGVVDENISGGISGALNPNSAEAQKHADLYYNEIRNRRSDVATIAKNTGFSVESIQEVKDHLFFNYICFADGTIKRFDSDYEQAQAWQRLISGKFLDNDIIFLNHELEELRYMRDNNAVYEIAHKKANEKYNWGNLISEKGAD